MREAILNAIVHKDYSSCNPIQIKVYPDKVYIFNSCRFPDKWTAKTLFRPHDSVRINPNIADVIFRTGMIETWGRGIAKIVAGCKRIGAPDPVYEVLPRNISLMFEAPTDGVYRVNGALEPIGSNSGSNGSNTGSKEEDDVSRVLRCIEQNPNVSYDGIALSTGMKKRTVQRRLQEMKEAGIVQRIGGTRGHWEIVGNS